MKIIHGPIGSGKTTRALSESEAEGLEVVTGDNPKKILADARHPSFFGKGRVALLEAEYYTRSEWNAVRAVLSASPPKVIIEVVNLESVPYAIRRGANTVYHPAPTQSELFNYLSDLSNGDFSFEVIQSISEKCSSYNMARNELLSFGEGAKTTGVRQPDATRASLTGTLHPSQSPHPLGVMRSALFNGEDPERVSVANQIHSQAWRVEGMAEVSQTLVETLRSNANYRKPPYSYRPNSYIGRSRW